MSRYRAPQKPSSNYVTAEGRQRLRDEVYQLWKVERPVVTQAVSDAAAQGDRSENADYIYGKRRLREIDSRVRYLANVSKILLLSTGRPKTLPAFFLPPS
jgi:transcription elongation factor GreB